jgi:hypothetical protein
MAHQNHLEVCAWKGRAVSHNAQYGTASKWPMLMCPVSVGRVCYDPAPPQGTGRMSVLDGRLQGGIPKDLGFTVPPWMTRQIPLKS